MIKKEQGDDLLITLRKLLETIAKSVVNKPESVVVKALTKHEGKQTLSIIVDKDDLGKIIGKNGQTIKSMRMLVNALSSGRQDIMVDVSSS